MNTSNSLLTELITNLRSSTTSDVAVMDLNSSLWKRICTAINEVDPADLISSLVLQAAAGNSRLHESPVDTVDSILKEVASHLAYDSGVNGSKFTTRPVGRIKIGDNPNYLWARMIAAGRM